MNSGKVVCIIPAYNADKTVKAVVELLRREIPDAHIIGIDDGSTDSTRFVLRVSCDEIVSFDYNSGKGAALRAGFKAALNAGADQVLTIDADGQHDATFAPKLLAKLDQADIVIGSRALNTQTVPPHRRLANLISTAATRWVARQPIPDSQSGFRAIKSDVIRKVDAVGDRYEFETDFLLKASIAGYKIYNVTVPTIYGPPSHFRTLSDAWLVTRILWSYRWALFRK